MIVKCFECGLSSDTSSFSYAPNIGEYRCHKCWHTYKKETDRKLLIVNQSLSKIKQYVKISKDSCCFSSQELSWEDYVSLISEIERLIKQTDVK